MAAAAAVHSHRLHCSLHTATRLARLGSPCCTGFLRYQGAGETAVVQAATCSKPSHTVAGSMVQNKIMLTSEERVLFDTLLAAAKHAGTNTVLRCAGGWVRDKLLGKESKDIDIALDNMLGREFAEKVNAYLASQGRETRTAAVIQSNPDQSKHLETARMKVDSIWIDLVNLRSETYADSSRIPKMEFGTPVQDAMRRDFTINSLFYNLNEDTTEDFTGKGLEDLRQGILRTPLPPHETFRDDPLRVLRAVRFATRFSFQPDPAIIEAGSSTEVRQALGSKVSRERIGTELEAMFNGVAPTAAVRLLNHLCLFPQVFTLPTQLQDLLGEGFGGPCVECMAAAEQLFKAVDTELSVDSRRLFLLAALLLPLRSMQYNFKANKQQPASAHVIRESLKWRVKEAEGVAQLHGQVSQLAEVHNGLAGIAAAEAPPEQLRLHLGRCIRQLKAQWKLGVLLAPLLKLPAATPLGIEPGTAAAGDSPQQSPQVVEARASSSSKDSAQQEQLLQQQVDEVRSLFAAAAGFELEGCWQWKPLLDGKQLINLLNVPKGPKLGQMTAAVMDWQLAHPQGSKEDCLVHVKACYERQAQS